MCLLVIPTTFGNRIHSFHKQWHHMFTISIRLFPLPQNGVTDWLVELARSSLKNSWYTFFIGNFRVSFIFLKKSFLYTDLRMTRKAMHYGG